MTDETKRQVRLARSRLVINQWMETFLWATTIALLTATVGLAAPKLIALDSVVGQSPWLNHWNALWIGGAILVAIVVANVWTWRYRRSFLSAAVEVDNRFQLKERLSSALSMTPEEQQSPFGMALTVDAETHAQRIDVRDEFRIRAGKRAWWLLVPAAVIAVLMFVPDTRRDNGTPITQVANQRKEIKTAVEEIKKTLEERIKQLDEKRLADLAEELKKLAKKMDDLQGDQESLKKEALIKLNDVRRRLNEQRNELGDARELKQELDRLKDVARGPAEILSKALSDGDFEKAKTMALELARKLKSGELSEAEQKRLAEDLRKMANEVNSIAQRHREYKERLEEQIKDAVRRGDLNQAESLRRQLDEAKKQDDLMNQMQTMAENMNRCAGECQKGNGGEQRAPNDNQRPEQQGANGNQNASQALEDLAEMMDQLQTNQEMMEALQDLERDLQACKEGLAECDGLLPGDKENGQPKWQDWAQGEGIGGGLREMKKNDSDSFKMRVQGQLQKGETIVTGNADGENIAGKSLEEAKELIQAEMTKQTDPLEDQRLPRSQREHAKEYFERLREGN